MSSRDPTATFSPEEVEALDQLLRALREGRDASELARLPALAEAHQKFLRMREQTKGSSS